MLVTVDTFSGFASMPWEMTMYPKRIPDETPKIHLARFLQNLNARYRNVVGYTLLEELATTTSLFVLGSLANRLVKDLQ